MRTEGPELDIDEFAAEEPVVKEEKPKKRRRAKEKVSKEEKPSNDDFRGKKAKGWFLTYPQCKLSKEQVLKLLEIKLTDYAIKEYVICEEKHETGDPHIHAFIKVDRQMKWMSDRFDIGGYHGHYEISKSWIATKKYVMKDGDYIANIDIKSAIAKKGKMMKEDLLKPVDYVLDNELITPMQVASFYKNQCAYKMLISGKKPIPENMPPKQRHLWVYGESNTGKTQDKLNWIKEKGEDNCFQIPYNGDWVGYNDQKYLYADEFKGQLSIQEINRICDGGAKMNVKGATVQLRWDVEVMICSNYEIQDCYKNADKVIVQALYNRFIVREKKWDPDYAKKNADNAKDEEAQNKDEELMDIANELDK